jgi:glycosyltransferase involved in cell wall biosynthesis
MQQADLVTTGSEYAADRLITLYGLPHEKVRVIPHGMAEPAWMPLVSAEPRVENDHPVLLSVGKMYPRKRLEILLRAIPLLTDRYPTLEARIVGDGLEWEKLHKVAAILGIEKHVTWLSHIGDDAQFAREWRQADVFVHPSAQESFGYVYLEAMLLGKAIVAAKAGAAPEVVGDAGLLTEPEDPAALASAIDRLLSDESLREEYGRRGKKRASRFTQAAMIDGYLRAIEAVAELRLASL